MANSGSRYVVPYATAFDTTGIVTPGALLNFYISGTSTRKDTYTNIGLTIPNSNPVQANGAGLFPSIFLAGAAYKVVLTTADGDEIWTADPVYGIGVESASEGFNFTTTAVLLAAFGSGVVLADGTQAQTVGRTAEGDGGGAFFYYDSSDTTSADNGGTIRVDAQNRRWYTLEQSYVAAELFGLAPGNSAAANSTALQSAIDWISSLSGGGTITFEGYTYNFNTVTVSASNVALLGKAPSATLHSQNTTRTNGLNFHGTSGSHISGCSVRRLGVTSTTTWSNGAVVGGVSTGAGIDTNFCDDFVAEENLVSNWSDGGIQIQDSQRCQVLNNRVDQTAQGIQIFAVTVDNFDNVVSGNIVTNTGLYNGIDIEGAPPGTFRNYGTVVIGNWVDTSWNKGINIELSNRATVIGNAVRASGQGSTQTPSPVDGSLWHGIALFGAVNCTVSGNSSFSNAGYGVAVYAGSDFTVISGNATISNGIGSCLVSDLATASISSVAMGANSWGEGDIVTSGNVDFLTRTTGFTFSNIASSGTNTLDWYEEGSFTPVAKGTSSDGAGTYSVQFGKFTRIGNRVDFVLNLAWNAHTGTGNIFLDGLPYTSNNGGLYPCAGVSNGLALTAANILQYEVGQGTKTILISQYSPTAGTSIDVPIDSSVTALHVSGVYFV